jgi:hypothetical protein
MEAKRSTGKYWDIFLFMACPYGYNACNTSSRPFFWLALPGVCTHFSLAMDII